MFGLHVHFDYPDSFGYSEYDDYVDAVNAARDAMNQEVVSVMIDETDSGDVRLFAVPRNTPVESVA